MGQIKITHKTLHFSDIELQPKKTLDITISENNLPKRTVIS